MEGLCVHEKGDEAQSQEVENEQVNKGDDIVLNMLDVAQEKENQKDGPISKTQRLTVFQVTHRPRI